MTPYDPAKTEPRASYNSETIDRFVAVLTATRMKAAEPFRHEPSQDAMIERERLLIEADEPKDDMLEHEGKSTLFGAFCQSDNVVQWT